MTTHANLMDMTDSQAQARLGKIGLIAGNGNFPWLLVDSMVRNGTPFAVAGLKYFAEDKIKEAAARSAPGGGAYSEFYLTDFGKIARFFKKQKVKTVVIIGGVSKKAVKINNLHIIKALIRLQFYKKKNDGIFRIIIRSFEKKGFDVVGVQDAMPSLLTKPGLLMKTKPSKQNTADTDYGTIKCREYGMTDKGQAIVVKDGRVLGYETSKGTDVLMEQCLAAKDGARGGVMIKLAKIGQEERGDIPAIGFKTIEQLISAKLDGIVVDAGYKTIIEEKEKLAKFADKNNIFIMAI